MAKRELKSGYRPLRTWERLLAYVSFIIVSVLMWHQAYSEGVSLQLALYTVATMIALPCAFIAFWDARVTARLRRREWVQRKAARSQAVITTAEIAEARFDKADGSWSYFEDSAPTTY